MRKAPYKGGGRIKGEPDKPVKSTIDRSKYAKTLTNPNPGNNDFVGETPESFTPAVLEANGYKYHSGTMGNKDIAYEKDGNIFLYNEQPTAAANKYRLTSIGNPFSNPPATTSATPSATPKVNTAPVIDPNRKPLDLSNPNMTYDPNTGTYKNPVTGSTINPIVEQYANGGKVKKAPKRGYESGGPVTNSYAESIARANQQNTPSTATTAKKDYSKEKNAAGQALGAYGTAYYATNPGDTTAENTRSAALGAVGQTGAIGGVIAGAAAIGDKIGDPIKRRSEATDEYGNLENRSATKRNAVIGSLFSPSKALAARSEYKGGWTDISGNGYANHLEAQAKAKIAADKAAEDEINASKNYWTNRGNIANMLTERNDMVTGYANGGKVKGPGTGKSDSINAKVIPGSFVVPAENAPIIEEIKEKVLGKSANKKANLNQKGGTEIKLSNKEHLLDPEEKAEIEQYGYDVDALAPDAEENEEVEGYKKGGPIDSDFEKAENAKIEAQRKADAKRIGEAQAKVKADQAKAALRVKIYNSLNKQLDDKKKSQSEYEKNKREYDALKKAYDDYDKASTENLKRKESSTDRTIGSSGRETPENVRIQKEKLLNKLQEKRLALDKSKQDVDYSNNEKNYIGDLAPKKGDNERGGLDYMNGDKTKSDSLTTNTPPVNTETPKVNTPGGRIAARVKNPSVSVDTLTPTSINQLPVSQTDNLYGERTADEAARMNAAPVLPNGTVVADPVINPGPTIPTSTTTTPDGRKKFDYSNILGNAINYGIPIAQTAIGLRQLKKAGDRPVDELDADYLNSLNATRAGVTQANDQARYGFTGAEKTLLDQQNQQLTNAGRYAARNLSGGSSANALNMERSVIDDSFGRALSQKVSDNALKLQKQQEAFNRQQALNSNIQDKQDRLRQYFGDDLNAWHQKTQSAAALTQAGLTNALDSYRADQRLKNFNYQMSQTNNFNNP